MLNELLDNWSNLLLAVVGLSAFVVYAWQKRDSKRAAATLLKSQIDSIEKAVTNLKKDSQLGNLSVYNSVKIMNENLWEKYKHMFVKQLSQSEIEIIQRFFDGAQQLERNRIEIIDTIFNASRDKSTVEHQIIGNLVATNLQALDPKIQQFRSIYRPLDLVFTPDITIQALTKNLSNFSGLMGTTAYCKIQKYSYTK